MNKVIHGVSLQFLHYKIGKTVMIFKSTYILLRSYDKNKNPETIMVISGYIKNGLWSFVGKY